MLNLFDVTKTFPLLSPIFVKTCTLQIYAFTATYTQTDKGVLCTKLPWLNGIAEFADAEPLVQQQLM